MAQYQSFPDAAGDSRTLEKLKALSLPSLAGRRFLDVGCNEGFFCGYAAFEGAERSVGLDSSEAFVARARRRFPACEFVCRGWDQLPEGPFDVILLASALHYAQDQPALVHGLMSRLAPDGVLVLELGIASSPRSEWVRVKRGIDEREFPSMAMVRDMLGDYAWKWMGPSVAQDGDPVARHVLHISRKRPVAYLLMQPPAFGKTTIARSLFAPAGVPVVSGDQVIEQVAKGTREVPDALRALLSERYSPFRLDEAIREVFDRGLGEDLVRAWLEGAAPGDLAIDAYVPQPFHEQVRAVLVECGYMPVSLCWERVGSHMPSADSVAQRAEAYYLALGETQADATGENAGARAPRPGGRTQGFVDDAELAGNRLTVRGWAVDESGRLPEYLSIRYGGREHLLRAFERQARPDVQRHLGLTHSLCGYVASVPVEPATEQAPLAAGLEVRAGNDRNRLGAPLPHAGPLARKLTRGAR
jgi:SAM-dependent methyltransferase